MSASFSISVIVPVFEDPDGISNCLRALEQQTVPGAEFEVIVVDNGSSPPIALPDSKLPHVTVIRCVKPGSYAARNAGARAALGPRLALTDADCIPDARWLETGMQALAGAGRDVIVGGEVRMVGVPAPGAVALYQALVGFQQEANIRSKGFSVTANLFCNRSVYERIGPFAEELLSGGDRDWGWRAARCGIDTVFVPEAIVATLPRTTLRGAIRQARRVAAGRRQLRQSHLAHGRRDSVGPHRGVVAQLHWIATRRQLGWFDRLRVLAVAGVIKVASVLESIRIRLGGNAERR